MKHYYAMAACALMALVGCQNTNNNTANHNISDNTQETLYADTTLCYKLVGNFSGTAVDTLVCRPVGSADEYGLYRTWQATSTNNTVEPLHCNNTIQGELYYEGDLDGNGTHEVGILHRSGTSSVNSYRIYTYNDRNWYYLYSTDYCCAWADYWSESEGEGEPLENMVQPGSQRGYVHIRYSDFRDGQWMVVDTIIQPNYEDIEQVTE